MAAQKKDRFIKATINDILTDLVIADAIARGEGEGGRIEWQLDEIPAIFIPIHLVGVIAGEKDEFWVEVQYIHEEDGFSLIFSYSQLLDLIYGEVLENWLEKFTADIASAIALWYEECISDLVVAASH